MTYADKAPQTTRFLWQGYRLLQEQRANGTRRTWSYDPESPWTPLAAIEQAGEGPEADIYWLNSDLNGAPLEVTDAEGNLRWSGQYDTFGRLLGQTVAGSAQRTGPVYEQPLRYAGQYQDNENGLHYNLFRYYEPEVGRFTTQDPVGLAGGLNLYAYAPNPYGWIDPLGLTTQNAEFRAAKQGAGIPKSTQFNTHAYVYDNKFENRTVYEFNVDGKKKYIIKHEDDKFGRGPHFHGADDLKENPMKPGKYNQYPGHYPEDEKGFSKKRKKC